MRMTSFCLLAPWFNVTDTYFLYYERLASPANTYWLFIIFYFSATIKYPYRIYSMDPDLSMLNALMSIGLNEQKAKETAKNEKLCKDLLEIIILVIFLSVKLS